MENRYVGRASKNADPINISISMDIRRLVTRIADALGPDALPEQVEAVAAVVLDEVRNDPIVTGPPLPDRRANERAILTVYGLDGPGILAGVTHIVSEAGCNILDVSQKILQGYFTLIMILNVTNLEGSMKTLQRELSELGERLGVRIMIQHEDLFRQMHRP